MSRCATHPNGTPCLAGDMLAHRITQDSLGGNLDPGSSATAGVVQRPHLQTGRVAGPDAGAPCQEGGPARGNLTAILVLFAQGSGTT